MRFFSLLLWRLFRMLLLWFVLIPIVSLAASWCILTGRWDDKIIFNKGWWQDLRSQIF